MRVELLAAIRCRANIEAAVSKDDKKRAQRHRYARIVAALAGFPKLLALFSLATVRVEGKPDRAAGGAIFVAGVGNQVVGLLDILGALASPLPPQDHYLPRRSVLALWPQMVRGPRLARRFRPLLRLARRYPPHVAISLIWMVAIYGDLRERFRRRPPALVPIVSDFTPRRLAAAAAANAEKIPVLLAQMHVHHQEVPPFRWSACLVLNRFGVGAYMGRGEPGAPMALRSKLTYEDKPRTVPQHPRCVGFAFHNKVTEKHIRDAITAAHERFPEAEISMRLHPNSKFSFSDLPPWASLTPKGQSIQEYSAHCDIAFVVNSSVQLEMVMCGLAVVHVPGLDDHRFDRYGYCKQGVVYACSSINETDIAELNRFYAAADWREKLLPALGNPEQVKESVEPLESISVWLNNRFTAMNTSDGYHE